MNPDWPNNALEELVQAVVDGENCVVTEVAFYSRDLRRRVVDILKSRCVDTLIEWECFDITDLEIANYNCAHDPDRTAEGIRNNLKQNQNIVQCLRDGKLDLPADCKVRKTQSRAE